ncbi:molybdopterin-guanine dinucleotide biosynthesis protein B [Dehalogenimonas sp. THU2]|uniref:molybdopterin-guanine dinucleotide biosynthesis protein B n=1 Tax=Dehalogenimonas sp. THU2 TaxID=3151121 RepID=UPI0032183A55
MPAPVVAFVGHSESGKTGYLERLLPELTRRGLKVATVKHVPQHFHPHTPARDTERHLAAGAAATVASTGDALILTKPFTAEAPFEEIGRLLGDEYDLILAEGFKQSGVPKIEVWRQGIGRPLENLKSRVAVVTSDDYPGTAPRFFTLDDLSGMADFLEKGFVQPQRQRVSLHINGAPVTLSAFPREFMANIVGALVASLKDVPPAKWLEIRLKKDSEDVSS